MGVSTTSRQLLLERTFLDLRGLTDGRAATFTVSAFGLVAVGVSSRWPSLLPLTVAGASALVVGQACLWRLAENHQSAEGAQGRAALALRALGAWLVVYAVGIYSPVTSIMALVTLASWLGDSRRRARFQLGLNMALFLALLVANAAGLLPPGAGAAFVPATLTGRMLHGAGVCLLLAASALVGEQVRIRYRQLRDRIKGAVRQNLMAEREQALAPLQAFVDVEPSSEGIEPSSRRPVLSREKLPSRIGPYLLGELLGSGPRGEVFAARKEGSKKLFAIKVLRPERLVSGRISTKFSQHAHGLGESIVERLQLPLEISAGRSDTTYVVSEGLEGNDLQRQLMLGGRLSFDQARGLVEQAARVLGTMHRGGLVHAALRPGNLFCVQDGKEQIWKLLDGGQPELAEPFEDASHASAAYLAPEVAEGMNPTAASDIYALSACLYRALTNADPFTGTGAELKNRVMGEMPINPVSGFGMPKQVAQVLRIGMAKAPRRRFETVEEFSAAFAASIEGELNGWWQEHGEKLEEMRPWTEPRRSFGRKRAHLAESWDLPGGSGAHPQQEKSANVANHS